MAPDHVGFTRCIRRNCNQSLLPEEPSSFLRARKNQTDTFRLQHESWRRVVSVRLLGVSRQFPGSVPGNGSWIHSVGPGRATARTLSVLLRCILNGTAGAHGALETHS